MSVCLRSFIIRMLAVATCCLAVGAAHADDTALRALQQQLEPLQSMRARFSQSVWGEAGEQLQHSQGTMAVKRGNRLRWNVETPYAYLIVTDGDTLWRYDADLEQAISQPFSGELADTPALIFSSDTARIGEYYRVEREEGGKGTWFRLEPREENALVQSLRLRFDQGAVAQLMLVDNLDQRTEVQFNDVVLNPTLDDALFSFEPPAGVDVIRDEP